MPAQPAKQPPSRASTPATRTRADHPASERRATPYRSRRVAVMADEASKVRPATAPRYQISLLAPPLLWYGYVCLGTRYISRRIFSRLQGRRQLANSALLVATLPIDARLPRWLHSRCRLRQPTGPKEQMLESSATGRSTGSREECPDHVLDGDTALGLACAHRQVVAYAGPMSLLRLRETKPG